MDLIILLKEHNIDGIFDRFDFRNTQKSIEFLSDLIKYAPFLSKSSSLLITEAISINPNLRAPISSLLTSRSDDASVELSKCIYAAYLGANTNIFEPCYPDGVFTDLSITCNEIEKYNGNVERFYVYSILSQLSLQKKECLMFLRNLPYDFTVDAIISDQSIQNISILIHMCKFYGFLEILEKKLSLFEKKNEIIGCIFCNYFSERDLYTRDVDSSLSHEIQVMKKILSEPEVLEYCKKVANPEYLGLITGNITPVTEKPKMSYAEFSELKFKNKDQFFDAFLELSSPSVSHFFTYLEMYRDKFKLTKKEKENFINKIRNMHREDIAYIEIVENKLKEYNFIK